MEKTTPSEISLADKSARDHVIIECFERSGDISLVILQAYQDRETAMLLSNKV